MSEGPKNNQEKGQGGASENPWDIDWPRYKDGENAGDDPSEISEEDVKYFQENPEELKKLVEVLIQMRGGEDAIKDGASWDKDARAYVDDNTGLPRDYAHLVGYLKKNPDKIEVVLREYSERDAIQKNLAAKEARPDDYDAIAELDEKELEERLRTEWQELAEKMSIENPPIMDARNGNEKTADWMKRVGMPTFEEFKRMKLGKEESANAEEEPTEKSWASMSDDEKREFIRNNPRNPGESTSDWAKRIGIAGEGAKKNNEAESGDEDAESEDDDAEQKEKKEIDREKMLEELRGHVGILWAGVNHLLKEVEDGSMSDEELQDYYEDYKNYEKRRNELLKQINTRDFDIWLKEKKDITDNDVENMTNDALEDLIAQYHEYVGDEEPVVPEEEEEEEEEEGEEAEDEEDPLVAVNLNREKDARAAARDIAERWLAEKSPKKGFFKRIAYGFVYGGMFREGFIKHYEKKAYEMIQQAQRGEHTTLEKSDWATKAGIEQFTMACVKNLENELIHTDAGESINTYGVETVTDEDGNTREVVKQYWTDENGVKHEKEVDDESAEAKATKGLREAIAKYAKDGDKNALKDSITVLKQELAQAGGNPDALLADNYMDVAEAARGRAEHGKAIEDVMAGFRFVNGEARSNVRTEAHRDALDKITERLSRMPVVGMLPPEIIGTVAGAVASNKNFALKTGLLAAGTVVFGAAAPAVMPLIVGMGVAGATAAARERNRTTGDRAQQARDMARGINAEDSSSVEQTNDQRKRYMKKSIKKGEQLAQTQYETYNAGELTDAINKAIESGDSDALLAAFAQADTAIKMSDKQGIDLIDYKANREVDADGNVSLVSDSETISQQRMALDIARAQAKVRLRELHRDGDIETKIADALDGAKTELETDISAKDKAFRKLRRRRMAGAGVKSAVLAGAAMVVSQEAMAFRDENKVGLIEDMANKSAVKNLGHELTHNNADAENTLLAHLVGLKQIDHTQAILYEGASEAEAAQYRGRSDCVVTQGEDKVVVTEQTISSQEALEGCQDAARTNWLNNGTSKSDGNELRGYYSAEKGVYTHVSGTSFGGGESVNLSEVTSDQVGFVVTINGVSKYVGAVGENGNFAPDLSDQPSIIADAINGRHFDNISFVVPHGVNADGVMEASSVWTFGGDGKIPSTVTSMVETVEPTFNIVQNITTESARGVAEMPFLPLTLPRINLPPYGRKRKATDAERGGNGGGSTPTPTPTGGTGGRPAGETPRVEPPTPEGGTPTPENNEGDSENPFDDDWGSGPSVEATPAPAPVAAEAPTPVVETTEAPAAPAAESTESTETESIDYAETADEGYTHEWPVRFNRADTRLSMTDNEIRRAIEAKGEVASRETINEIRRSLETWNAMDESIRKKLLDGRRKVDHRKITDYGADAAQGMANSGSAGFLKEYGILVGEPEIEPDADDEELDMAA